MADATENGKDEFSGSEERLERQLSELHVNALHEPPSPSNVSSVTSSPNSVREYLPLQREESDKAIMKSRSRNGKELVSTRSKSNVSQASIPSYALVPPLHFPASRSPPVPHKDKPQPAQDATVEVQKLRMQLQKAQQEINGFKIYRVCCLIPPQSV